MAKRFIRFTEYDQELDFKDCDSHNCYKRNCFNAYFVSYNFDWRKCQNLTNMVELPEYGQNSLFGQKIVS